EVMAAPCNEESSTRRSALPRVRPKPRSSGSATTVATRVASSPGSTDNALGLIRVCQFFCSTRTSVSKAECVRDISPAAWPPKLSIHARCQPDLAGWRLPPQTPRRLGGRQPLVGLGVTSRLELLP